MPELAEVETVIRGLRAYIINKKILYVTCFRKNLRYDFPENFTNLLKDRKIIDIKRRSKYIVIFLDNDHIFLSHLGMTGNYRFLHDKNYTPQKHDHVIIELDDGLLIYNDIRRFGLMDYFPLADYQAHKLIKDLGVEPLTDDFTPEYLLYNLKNKSVPIKNALMDSKLVVGIGNIYAAESLFKSKISPLRASNSLNKADCTNLVQASQKILLDAIKAGGSTLKDFIDSDGNQGYFQFNFNVYGRAGKNCAVCNSIIQKQKQAGRTSFFCKSCQI